jgi:hypothetical protein
MTTKMTPDQKIKEALNKGEIQMKTVMVGCCRRTVLTSPQYDKKFYYNPNKKLTKTLEKIFTSNNIYKMSGKTLNKNKNNNLNIDLKFEKQNKNDDRTWVNKDSWPEFEREYQDLQHKNKTH